MKGSDFIFDSIQLMHYKCHEVNFKRGGSYIDSPDWIKNKKGTINPRNEDDTCFQYAATVALNYKEIESHPERVSNIEPFINTVQKTVCIYAGLECLVKKIDGCGIILKHLQQQK